LVISNFDYAPLDNNVLCKETNSGAEFVIVGELPKGGARVGSFPGPISYEIQIRQSLAFKFRTSLSPFWSMGQTGARLYVPDLTATTHQVAEMELHSALPVPRDDMSFVDVLEFKHARMDELIAFRHALDKMYLNIVNSNDIPRQTNVEVYNLQKAIQDLNSVANESWGTKILRSLKVETNVPNLARNAFYAEAAAMVFGFPSGIGAALGAMAAAVKFELVSGVGIKGMPSHLKDYAYLADISKVA
jgi:hypothetical protein